MSSHQTLLDRFLVFAPRYLPSFLFFPNSDFPSTPHFLRSLLFFPTRISLSILILFPPFFFFPTRISLPLLQACSFRYPLPAPELPMFGWIAEKSSCEKKVPVDDGRRAMTLALTLKPRCRAAAHSLDASYRWFF